MLHQVKIFFFTISILSFTFLSSNPAFDSLSPYYDYLEKYQNSFGKIGDYKNGEIELITDFNQATQAQENYLHFFLKRGCPLSQAKEFSRLGIVAEDSRWIWIRDPIRLPNGETTGYNRFMPKSAFSGVNSVSILGISEQNEILVNLIYRHATREWEIELPRGGNDKGEDSKQAAQREFIEETGYLPEILYKISSVAADSGIVSNYLDIYFAKDLTYQKTNREAEEAILSCQFISKEVLKEGFSKGSLKLRVNGKTVEAKCRDAFLATALLVAEYKNLI